MKSFSARTYPLTQIPQQEAPLRDFWRELALISFMVIELSWIVPWTRLLISTELEKVSLLRTLLVIGGIYLGIYMLERRMDRYVWPDVVRQFLSGVLLVGSVMVGLKGLLYYQPGLTLRHFFNIFEELNRPSRETVFLLPIEFFLVPLILAVGWRSLTLAKNVVVGPISAQRYFRWGLILFSLYGITIALVPRVIELAYGIQLSTHPGTLPLAFILASLIGMSAARISGLRSLRGGHQIPFERQRVFEILLPVFGWGSLAFLVGRLGESQWLHSLARSVYALLLNFIALLASPFVWFYLQTTERVADLGSTGIPLLEPTALPTSRPLENFGQPAAPSGIVQSPVCASPPLVFAILLLGVLLVLFFTRTGGWLRRQTGQAEIQQSLTNRKDFLQPFIKRVWDLATSLGQGRRMRDAERNRAAARIRKIYADLLDLCVQLNYPRQEWITPLEFLPTLYILFPTLPSEVERITAAYQRVRYGGYPETRREVRSVETAWRRVSAAGQSQLSERKRRTRSRSY